MQYFAAFIFEKAQPQRIIVSVARKAAPFFTDYKGFELAMHELPMILRLLDIARKAAQSNQLTRVTKIRVRIGELSDLVDSCMQLYFESASAGTVCEEAKLEIVREPVRLRCVVCGQEFSHKASFSCPVCGGDTERIPGTGSGFVVESIEGEA